MIEQVLLMFMLSCGQPYMGIMWGGEVQPQRFPIEATPNGNILVPNEVAEDYAYIANHPDLEVEKWETVDPSVSSLVCATRLGS